MTTADPDTPPDPDAPADGPDGAATCSYCGRRFAREEWLALHRGHEHDGRLSPEERAAFEAAHESEERELRRYRLKALGALVLLYFGFLITFALVL